MRDVAWFQFFCILLFKAAEAGKVVVKVPSRGTSQTCSGCQKVVEKDLSVRVHACPFCGLKIDRDFISDMGHYGESNHIVQAVISLGKGLGMRVNAEGIETHLQADMLRIEGCDELQGYFFGKPMPIDELEQLIESKSGSDFDLDDDQGDACSNSPSQKIVRIA